MGREVVVTKGGPLIGRLFGGAGRAAPKVAAAGAAATGLAGAGWLISKSLSGNNPQSNGGDGSSSATSMGGGGLSGGRAGLASSRGFTAPGNDNSPRKVSYNPNGNFESESLRLQASSANSLASIDNTVKNMLKFSVAKANWDTRSLREMSIESGNNAGGGGGHGGGMFAAVNGNRDNQGGVSPLLVLGLTAAAGAVAIAISKFGQFFGGGNSPSSQTGSSGGLVHPAAGSAAQQLGIASAAAGYTMDAARGAPRAAGSSITAANDNRPRSSGARGPSLSMAASQGRLGTAITSRAGQGAMKVFRFLKGLRATPVGRFPIITSVFALIDPLEAAIMSGGEVNDSVKRELVGAIAMILAGPAGIALGAAIGAAVGIPATPIGMAAGAILGGLAGAAAALSAEFVAEQIYDLIAGNITLGEFVRKLGRGAMNGVRNTGALVGGAIVGGAVGAVGLIARGTGGGASRAAAAAPAAERAAGGGMRISPRAAVIGTGAVAVVAGSVGASMVQSRAPVSGPALMNLSGSELHTAARTAAEQYLGRRMTDQEWDYLLRAVYAESGRGGAGRENAMIMATILNRARSPQGHTAGATAQAYLRSGLTVLAALYGRNQFQAVTGTAASPRPSAHFTRGPNQNELDDIFRSVVQFLHRVPHSQIAFTAAASGAYGAGTNIGYRDTMLRNGGVTIGGTVFNTSLAGENIAQTASPAAAPVTAAPASSANSPTAGMSPPPAPGNLAGSGGGGGRPAPTGDEGTAGSNVEPVSPPTGPTLETLRRYNLKDDSHIKGLKGPFADKMARFLHAAAAAGKTIKINSGYRSIARQAQLYAAAVAKYGAAGARKWVAPPGRSKHNYGLAIDLVYGNNSDARGTQTAAGRAAKMWAHANAARFGLNFRMGHEPWHIEPSGAVIPPGQQEASASAGAAAHAALPRSGGGRDMTLGAGAARTPVNWSGVAAPMGLSGGAAPYDSEGGSPTSAMSAATPESRTVDNIVKASVAAERKRMNVVVQNTQTQTAGKQPQSKNQKTDTSAAESVSSPVMAAYEYAAYWGVD